MVLRRGGVGFAKYLHDHHHPLNVSEYECRVFRGRFIILISLSSQLPKVLHVWLGFAVLESSEEKCVAFKK